MRTTSQVLIDTHTDAGWWGKDTLCSLLDDVLEKTPDRTALVDAPNRSSLVAGAAARLSYREVAKRADSISAVMHASGIRANDIVVVQLPNIVELPILYLALARLGAIASPVPVQYGRHELAEIRTSLDASAYVSVARFKDEHFMADRVGVFSGCTLFALASDVDTDSDVIDLQRFDLADDDCANYDAYRKGFTPDANDVLTICWTSGTTGTPKGVPRSHNHWWATSIGSGDLAELRDADVLLNPFPLVNMGGIGGFLFNWLKCSGSLVLHHPMDLPVFLKQISDESVNYTIAPPALLNMLLQNRQLLDSLDLSALRSIGSGSAPLSPWMVQGYEKDYGIHIMNNFGSNEGMCLVSGPKEVPDPTLRGELFPRFGFGGFTWKNRIADMFVAKIIDVDTGEEILAPGVAGEMLMKGPTVFDGYWNSPEANAGVFSEDGFFHTGDMFEIAGAGEQQKYYRFVGRHKDIISRGGMKISPSELDNLLTGHEKIADAAVVGVADKILGERVAVAVVPKPEESVTLGEIIAFLKDKDIAVFKLPEMLKVCTTLPRNPIGKVLRHELAPLFYGEQGDIEE